MMTTVVEVVGQLTDSGLRLLKAIPRGPDQLNLEMEDLAGEVQAGWWFRDRAAGVAAADGIRSAMGDGCVRVLDGSGIVILRQGVDARLPVLRELLARPGVRLLAHRLEIRAVLREADGGYTKVVRPRHAARIASALLKIRLPNIVVPTLTAFDPDLGTVTTTALPGATFHERLRDHSLSDEDLVLDAKRIGAAVRDLHEQPAASVRPPHDAAAELTVSRRWLDAASDHGVIARRRWSADLDRAERMLDEAAPGRLVMMHRDLHEKQLLIVRGQPIALLDLDELGPGDPAIDVGNMLAHFELRAIQNPARLARTRLVTAAFLDGYSAEPDLLTRVPAYLLSARLRLAAVYAFRAAPEDLVEGLLHPAPDLETLL